MWQNLRWGANGAAHWASCKACKLKKVLYYSMDHGALTAKTVLEEDPMDVWMLEHAARKVILDSGCRTAVAGAKWHVKMRQALDQRDPPMKCWSTRRPSASELEPQFCRQKPVSIQWFWEALASDRG